MINLFIVFEIDVAAEPAVQVRLQIAHLFLDVFGQLLDVFDFLLFLLLGFGEQFLFFDGEKKTIETRY